MCDDTATPAVDATFGSLLFGLAEPSLALMPRECSILCCHSTCVRMVSSIAIQIIRYGVQNVCVCVCMLLVNYRTVCVRVCKRLRFESFALG